MFTVFAADQSIGFFVTDDLFGFWIEVERSSQSRRNIPQVTE